MGTHGISWSWLISHSSITQSSSKSVWATGDSGISASVSYSKESVNTRFRYFELDKLEQIIWHRCEELMQESWLGFRDIESRSWTWSWDIKISNWMEGHEGDWHWLVKSELKEYWEVRIWELYSFLSSSQYFFCSSVSIHFFVSSFISSLWVLYSSNCFLSIIFYTNSRTNTLIIFIHIFFVLPSLSIFFVSSFISSLWVLYSSNCFLSIIFYTNSRTNTPQFRLIKISSFFWTNIKKAKIRS